MIISLSILLALSIAANVLLVWYIKRMLKELLFSSDNIVQLQLSLSDFSVHLEGVYNQETYYGDPTIEGLIKHAKEIVTEINDFQDIYSSARDETHKDFPGEEEDGEEN